MILDKKFKNLIEWIKDRATNRKKFIENCLIMAIIGIIIIIAGGTFIKKSENNEKIQAMPDLSNEDYGLARSGDHSADEVESKLESILSKIKGAGKVSVMITYSSGKSIEPAYDKKNSESDTLEKDSNGGNRTITQTSQENSLAYEELQGGSRKVVVLNETMPQVKGAVVIAEGASDASVREDISKAVEVLLDLPMHKIQVLEMRK